MSKTIHDISEIIGKFRNKTSTIEDTQRLFRVLDPQLQFSLKREFNAKSGIPVLGKSVDYNNDSVLDALKRKAIQNSDAPETLNTLEKYRAYERTTQHVMDDIKGIIKSTPALSGFTLSDAVALAGNETQQRSVFQRFPQADRNIMMASAYLILDNSKTELAQQFPAFAQKHEKLGTRFSDMASINIFYSVQDDQKYKDWEQTKRAQILDRIAKDPVAQQALFEIKSPLNTKSTHDIIGQYDARAKLAARLTTIYADVYDLKTLDPSDVRVLHKSLNEFAQNSDSGFTWETKPGVRNDELVILNYNPVYGLLQKDNPDTTDNAARTNFVNTAVEELQHVTDQIYGDKLINKELDSTHPAFNHTSLVLLNRLQYTKGSDDYAGYNNQIVERSAKEVAAYVAKQTIQNMRAPEAAPSSQTTAPSPAENNPPTLSQIKTPSIFGR